MWFNIIVLMFSIYQAQHVTKVLLTPRDAELISIFTEITIMLTFFALNKMPLLVPWYSVPSPHWMSFPSHTPLLKSISSTNALSCLSQKVFKVPTITLKSSLIPFALMSISSLKNSSFILLQMCQSKFWCWWSTCFLNCHHISGHKGIC